MSNILKRKLKHGFFSYYSNDQYIGKSLSEYGEWSEAEVILLTQLLSTNENIVIIRYKLIKNCEFTSLLVFTLVYA